MALYRISEREWERTILQKQYANARKLAETDLKKIKENKAFFGSKHKDKGSSGGKLNRGKHGRDGGLGNGAPEKRAKFTF